MLYTSSVMGEGCCLSSSQRFTGKAERGDSNRRISTRMHRSLNLVILEALEKYGVKAGAIHKKEC